jgi:hypothetical protein
VPKLENYTYPYIKLSRAIDIARRICEAPYNGEISVTGLAQELGMAETGGGFLYVVAALRDYGLMEGTGNLRATEIARKIVAGTSDEMSKSRAESFLKIELFRKLEDKIGITVPETTQFSVVLRDLTQADPLKVKKVAKTIRNLYLDGVPYLKSAKEQEMEDNQLENQESTDNIDKNQAKPTEGIEQLTLGASIKVWLPKGDKEAAKKAIQLIKLYSGITEED